MGMYDRMLGTARAREREAMHNYRGSREDAQSFDINRFLDQAAGAKFSELSDRFARQQAGWTSGANARGFSPGGTGMGKGAIIRDQNDAWADARGMLAMQAGQMEQNRLMQLLAGDQQRYGSAEDTAYGLGVSQAQQAAADAASRRQMWGNILQGGLGLAGTLLGGPIGGAIGSSVGGMIGGGLYDSGSTAIASGRPGGIYTDPNIPQTVSPLRR